MLSTTWGRGIVLAAMVVVSTAVSLYVAELLARRYGVDLDYGRQTRVEEIPTRVVDGVLLWSDGNPRADADDLRRAAENPATFTILGFGDSIMFGVGLDKHDTYLEVARREIAARSGDEVAMLNMAVPGFNTRQENALYKEVEGEVRPDLVIVHYWSDDNHQYRMAGGYVIDYGDISDDGRFIVRALPLPPRLSDYLLVHSVLYRLLTQFVVRNQSRGMANWDAVAQPLMEIQERARRAGARLLVLASTELDTPTPRAVYNLPVLRELAAAQGFEVIDLSEWLQGVESASIAMDACHFNAKGHRILGEHLADYLLEHDLKNAAGG